MVASNRLCCCAWLVCCVLLRMSSLVCSCALCIVCRAVLRSKHFELAALTQPIFPQGVAFGSVGRCHRGITASQGCSCRMILLLAENYVVCGSCRFHTPHIPLS